MDVKGLAVEVHQTAVDHGWWPETICRDEDCPGHTGLEHIHQRNVGETLMLVVTEVADLYTRYKDGTGGIPEIWWDDNGKPQGCPIEAADVIIRMLDLAEGFGIDIIQALALKVDYNQTRPYRHGNRRA